MSATHNSAGIKTLTLQIIIGLLFFYFLMPTTTQAATCRVWVPIAVDDISFIIPAWVEDQDSSGLCLDVSSPAEGSTVTGDLSNVNIVGTVGDAVDTLKINTTTVTVTNNTFSHAVTVTEGSNTVTLEVADSNGATLEKELTFDYNVVHPVDDLSGPDTLGSTNGNFNLSWTEPSSGTNGVDDYEIEHEHNGVLQSPNLTTTTIPYNTASLNLENGVHRFRVRACNNDGCGDYSDWITIIVSQSAIAGNDLPANRAAPSETSGSAAADADVGDTFNGILSGSHDVTGSGAATYRIPIAVPPGTNGVQPSLSLNYNSQSGSGLLGDGWSVGGIGSVITRCGKNIAEDSGTVHAVDYTSDDQLCFNGQRLLLASGTYWANGSEYRTRVDGFSRIKAYDNGSDGIPDYFTVETKGRQTLYFGDWDGASPTGDDALIEAKEAVASPTWSVNAMWLLSRVKDKSSNYMDYSYEVETDHSDYRPKKIEYSGNVGKSLDPYAKVEFTYQNRTVAIDKYRAGSKSTGRKRLTNIKTYVDSDNDGSIDDEQTHDEDLVRDYRLTYETDTSKIGIESRNHLIEIKQCVPDGASGTVCSEETKLDWVAVDGDYDNSTWDGSSSAAGDFHKWADLNGDGRMDYITSDRSGSPVATHQVSLAKSDASGYESASNWTATALGSSGFETFTDLNGDGKADYLTTDSDSTGTHHWYLSNSAGDGYTDTNNTYDTNRSIAATDKQHVLDLNADGLVDYLLVSGSQYYVRLNNGGTGYQNEADWNNAGAGNAPDLSDTAIGTGAYNLHDANGDGFPDIVVIAGTSPYGHTVYLNNGSGFDAGTAWTPHTSSTADGYWSDPNGDGLLDYITIDSTDTTKHHISFSTGAGYVTGNPTWTGAQAVKSVNSNQIIEFKDMNGDGLIDFVTFDNQNKHYISFSDGTGYNNDDWTWTASGTYYGAGSTGIYDFVDLDGDGKTDFATVNTNGDHLVSISRCSAIHLMNKVTDGLDVVTTFDYKPLTDTSIYTKGSSADLTKSEVDVINATHVVAEMTHSNPIHSDTSATLSASYTYEGFKFHRQGYGSLGFSKSTVVDNERNTTTISEYNQSEPTQTYKFRGTLKQTEVRQTSTNNLLAKSVFTYKEKDSEDSSGASSIFVEKQEQYLYDPLIGETAHLSTTTTTNLLADRDGYGNSKITTVAILDKENNNTEHKRTTTRTIVIDEPNDNDVTNWFIGQVDTVVVKNEITTDKGGINETTTWISDKDRTTDFVYDSKGRVTEVIREPTEATKLELKLKTVRHYDDASVAGYGNLEKEETWVADTSTTYTLHSDEHITYDAARSQYPATLTNAEDHVTEVEYDDRFGVVDKITDINDLITTRSYDNFGRLTGEDRPDGTEATVEYKIINRVAYPAETGIDDRDEAVIYTQSNEYDNQGNDTLAVTPTRIFYDAQGREVRRRVKGFDGVDFIHTDTEYDSRGRVKRSSQPYYDVTNETVHWNTPDYDDFNRIVGFTAADETENRTTDYDGFVVTSEDALGRQIIQTRNAIGQVIKMEDQFQTATTYEYDQVGNLVKVKPDGNTALEVVNTYDRLGRKTSIDDPDAGLTEFTYNALSELVEQETPRLSAASRKLELSYDKLGRLVERLEPHIDGSGNIHASDTLTTTWSYDDTTVTNNLGIGKLHQEKLERSDITPPLFTRTYTYDKTVANNAGGQLTETKTEIEDISVNPTVKSTYYVDLDYDKAGRVQTVTYPESPSYTPGRFKVEYKYNAPGYLERVVDDLGTTNTVYYQATSVDAEGRITGQYLGDGSLNKRGYVPGSSRLAFSNAALDEGSNTKFDVQNHTYTYDGVGNLQTRSDLLKGLVETFEYDALQRLTQSTVNDNGTNKTPVNIAYDDLGNIGSKDDFSYGNLIDYSYGASAGPHAVTGIDTDGATGNEITYTYDANGNQTSDGAGTRDITWTSFDKPATIKDGATRTFYYGPDRLRYQQNHTDGTTTHYVGELYEKVTNGNSEDHRHLIYANGQVVAVHSDDELDNSVSNTTETNYWHRDHLGSITAITDNATSASQLPEYLSYDAFGKRRSASDWDSAAPSTISEVRGYTGHEHLDDMGIIHMNGRVYDPTLGRMLSPDPIVQSPFDTQNWNRYSHVLNNPNKYTDPSGYFAAYIGAFVTSYTQTVTEFTGTNAQRQSAINGHRASGTIVQETSSNVIAYTGTSFKYLGRQIQVVGYIFHFISVNREGYGGVEIEPIVFIWDEFHQTDFFVSIDKPVEMMDPVPEDPGPDDPMPEPCTSCGDVNAVSAGSFQNGILANITGRDVAEAVIPGLDLYNCYLDPQSCSTQDYILGGIGVIPGGGKFGALGIKVVLGGLGKAGQVLGQVYKKGKDVLKKDVPNGPKPNGGIAPKHGGTAHNDAIDQRVRDLQGDSSVTNIRKNQQQVDVNGNKVGTNRPDIQFDQGGCHHCVEYDTIPRNSTRHGEVIRANDPKTKVELNQL